MDELKEALRKSIFAQREMEAQRAAKDKLVDKLVDANDFPVPENFRRPADRESRRAAAAFALSSRGSIRDRSIWIGPRSKKRSARRRSAK